MPVYEFAEVPPDVIHAFSQRTAQIDDAVGRDASPFSRSVAALDTRKNKEFVEGEARREQWDKVLSDYDFDPDKVIQAARERGRSHTAERGEADSAVKTATTAEPALKEAVTQALSSLSDKKAQFAYSVFLPGDFRVIGSSDARFAGQSRNGESRIAESLPEGLLLAQQHPDSGVIVRMEGEGLPLNISRITGADQVVDDSLTAQFARNVAEKPETPLPFIPEPKENAEQEAERLAREALEKQGKGEKDIRPEDIPAAISEPEDDIDTGLLAGKLKEDEYPLTGRDIAAALGDKSPEKELEAENQPDQSLHLKQIERDIVKEKSFED
ncbi:hypothetical protein FD733_19320 (plasmid) [Pantoea sp. Eser]|nr:hypothetical protein [Pantoea sp. Eser]